MYGCIKIFGKGQINLPSHPQIAQSVTIGLLCRLTTIEIMGRSTLHLICIAGLSEGLKILRGEGVAVMRGA